MAVKNMYVPDEGADTWNQFTTMAAEMKLSVSALLMMLVRSFVDGHITIERTVKMVKMVSARAEPS